LGRNFNKGAYIQSNWITSGPRTITGAFTMTVGG